MIYLKILINIIKSTIISYFYKTNYSGIVGGKMIDTTGTQSTIKIIESGTLIKHNSGWKLLNGQSAVLNTDTKN